MRRIEIIESTDNFELVKVGNQEFCYQINKGDLREDGYCLGAYANFKDANQEFNNLVLLNRYERQGKYLEKMLIECEKNKDFDRFEYYEELLNENNYQISNLF